MIKCHFRSHIEIRFIPNAYENPPPYQSRFNGCHFDSDSWLFNANDRANDAERIYASSGFATRRAYHL